MGTKWDGVKHLAQCQEQSSLDPPSFTHSRGIPGAPRLRNSIAQHLQGPVSSSHFPKVAAAYDKWRGVNGEYWVNLLPLLGSDSELNSRSLSRSLMVLLGLCQEIGSGRVGYLIVMHVSGLWDEASHDSIFSALTPFAAVLEILAVTTRHGAQG